MVKRASGYVWAFGQVLYKRIMNTQTSLSLQAGTELESVNWGGKSHGKGTAKDWVKGVAGFGGAGYMGSNVKGTLKEAQTR